MSDLPEPRDLLPHAPPFLFVDEVIEVGPGTIKARRTFRPDEDFFRGHFPDRPIVPGVLLIEAMAQTFAYLIMKDRPLDGVYLTGIDRARFRAPVLPGHEVVFTVEIEGERLGLVKAKAEARVGGQKVADARLTGRAAEA
jgi:3-hydroxymyristoyl/3-hydroxydecanoyl-(acyl carrier protein) dehydratase